MNGQLTIKKFFENSCIRFNQGIEACIYMFINTSSSFPNVSYWCLQYWLQYCIKICMFFLLNQLIPQRNCNLSTPLLSCYPWMKLEYLLILLFKICSCATFLCLFSLPLYLLTSFWKQRGVWWCAEAHPIHGCVFLVSPVTKLFFICQVILWFSSGERGWGGLLFTRLFSLF